MNGKPHFSVSQLKTFLRCPKQYEFKYVQGLRVPPSLLLNSGKAIHATLEGNSKHKMSKKVDMDIDDMRDLQAAEHDRYTADVEDATKKEIGQDKDASLSIVGTYRRTQAPYITPIAVEYGFSVEIPEALDDGLGPLRPVIGFIDSFAQVPDTRPGPTKGQGVIALEDYKKVRKRKSQLEVDIDPQLTMYDYVYNLHTEGELTDVIGFRQLGYNGPRAQQPGPFSEPLYRSNELLEPERRRNRWTRVLNQMKNAQRQIEAGRFLPVDDPRTCSWCDYKAICQDKVE